MCNVDTMLVPDFETTLKQPHKIINLKKLLKVHYSDMKILQYIRLCIKIVPHRLRIITPFTF